MNWRHLGLAVIAVAMMAALPSTGLAQSKEKESQEPIKVGQKAPEFKLAGADGKKHTLAEYRKKGIVALLFFRSADW